MIIEGPVLNLLRFDTYDADAEAWVPWAEPLNSLEVERGGKRAGVTTTVEPGLLTATLVNAGDPVSDVRVRPNVPVRVVTPYTPVSEFNTVYEGVTVGQFNSLWAGKTVGQFNAAFTPLFPVFTGRVLDIITRFQIDKTTGEKTRFVTVTATDAVQSHSAKTRYGVLSDGDDGYESWASRIMRLAASSATEIQPPGDNSPIVRYSL